MVDESLKPITFIPLDGIVNANPETRILDKKELFPYEGRHGYKTAMDDLEQRLFKERQSGEFFVFHPSVLGMAPVYRVPRRGYIAFETISDGTIVIPDAAIMKQVEAMLPPEEYKKLNQFYEMMRQLGGEHKGLNIAYTSNSARPVIKNLFDGQLDVYHNGVRVKPDESFELISGDVIRIGHSILLGYFTKGRIFKIMKIVERVILTSPYGEP